MTTDHLDHLASSRAKLLRAIGQPERLTFLRQLGNVGDHLIHAGARKLLDQFEYDEVSLANARTVEGHTALIAGGGGYCGPFHGLAPFLPLVEERFQRVIVLPSTFDTSIDIVRKVLSNTGAVVFAREEVSFQQIRDLCEAEIACDTAFFFDYSPYQRWGAGTLTAFRVDQESAFRSVPTGNRDISVQCDSLDEWLWTIARHALIRTDRAHVTIAGALLGKRVEYLSSSYHKVPAIVDYSLRGFPVSRLPDDWMILSGDDGSQVTEAEHLRVLIERITALVPEGSTFVLVDNDKVGSFPHPGRTCLPFLERDGIYWGPPPNDDNAIHELERMRTNGAQFLVFAWPAFWWLEHYVEFLRYLRAAFPCLLENSSLVVFDLQSGAHSQQEKR